MNGNKFLKPAWIVLGISAILVLANLAFGFLLSGQAREVAACEDKIADLKSLTSPRHASGVSARAQVMRFKEALPDEGELTSILEEVFKAAARNGISIPSGDYNPVTSKDGAVARYVFTLPVEGRYSSLKRFLYELEADRRPLVVEEVTLADANPEKDGVALRITMSAYYR